LDPALDNSRVTVALDPASVYEGTLVIQLTSPGPSGRRQAILTAVGGASSTCESAAEIRFTVVGELPATLSLTIASLRATVAILRGDEVIAESALSDSAPVRMLVPTRRR
jgi:hypothetical protein